MNFQALLQQLMPQLAKQNGTAGAPPIQNSPGQGGGLAGGGMQGGGMAPAPGQGIGVSSPQSNVPWPWGAK